MTDDSIKAPMASPAVEPLGGYAYQLYASCLAWMALEDGEDLYIEVAEDYAKVLPDVIHACQVKRTHSALTLNSQSIRDTVDAFVGLVISNPKKQIWLDFLTTAQPGVERALKERIDGEGGLVAWQMAADGNLSAEGWASLRSRLAQISFKPLTRQFIDAQSDSELRTHLFQRIRWRFNSPDLDEMRRECQERLVELAHRYFPANAADAARVLPKLIDALLYRSQKKKVVQRVLRKGELIDLMREATHHLISTSDLIALTSVSRKKTASQFKKLDSWSSAFAYELNQVGIDINRQPLLLSEGLYVVRKRGDELWQRLSSTSNGHWLSVICGDAGYGKSSLMWWLFDKCSSSPQFIPFLLHATWLEVNKSVHYVSAEMLSEACAEVVRIGKRPVILVDTVDLLLRNSDGGIALVEKLDLMEESGALVILSTRPQEAAYIDRKRFPYSRVDLGAYSDEELATALNAYAARYYRMHPDLSTRDHFSHIRQSVALGHPVRDLCIRPLAMRMLFDIYAPDSIPEEVHIFRLYCDYWLNRVVHDQRTACRLGAPVEVDLSSEALWIALYMLCEGNLEIEENRILRIFERRKLNLDGISQLIDRGILQRTADQRIHFFHQSFFEHAAARALDVLFPVKGLGLLVKRCKDFPEDFALKPILQHALLMAEDGGSEISQLANDSVSSLIDSKDLSDQSVALYVHCHCLQSNSQRKEAVTVRLLSSHDPVVRITFIQFASNLSPARQGELDSLLVILWKEGSLRERKHLLQLLTRLAPRRPGPVLDLINACNIREYATGGECVKDEVPLFYAELLGSLLLYGHDVKNHPIDLVIDLLRHVLRKPQRLDVANKIVGFIRELPVVVTDEILMRCAVWHSTWTAACVERSVVFFMDPYCALLAERWRREGRVCNELVEDLEGKTGPELEIQLRAFENWLGGQPSEFLPVDLDIIVKAYKEQNSGVEKMAWARLLLGPALALAYQWPADQGLVLKILSEFVAEGFYAWRAGRGKLALGLAVRLIHCCELSSSHLAQVLATQMPSPDEWLMASELTPFMLTAMDGHLISAEQAYRNIVADSEPAQKHLNTLLARLTDATLRGRPLADVSWLMHTLITQGEGNKLLECMPFLMEQGASGLKNELITALKSAILGRSSKVSNGIVQALPGLLKLQMIDRPTLEDTLQWIRHQHDWNPKLHLACWGAEEICVTESDALGLLAWLDCNVLPLRSNSLWQNPFFKEKYLHCCATLSRRGLLMPFALRGGDNSITWADHLLEISVMDPVREDHLTMFGWILAAATAYNAQATVVLLKHFLSQDATRKISRAAQRDLSRHLLPPMRALFQNITTTDQLDLLNFSLQIPPPLARSLIFLALTANTPQLNERLSEVRLDQTIDSDLRKLIMSYMRHNVPARNSEVWHELMQLMI